MRAAFSVFVHTAHPEPRVVFGPRACAPSPPPLVIKASLAAQPPPYEWLFRATTSPRPVCSGTDLRPPTLALALFLTSFCEREVCPVIPEKSPASSAASTRSCQVPWRAAGCPAAPSRSQQRPAREGPPVLTLPCFGFLQLPYRGVTYVSQIVLASSAQLSSVL